MPPALEDVEAVRILQKGHQVAKIPLTAMLNISSMHW